MPSVSDGRGELSSKSPMALPPAVLTGVVDGMNKPSDDFSAGSTCTLDAVANGDYESSGPCVVGATLYSGYRCTPTVRRSQPPDGPWPQRAPRLPSAPRRAAVLLWLHR